MTIQFRPAVRAQIPCVVGLAGPSKSGKTNSAHRLAKGMAAGGRVVMINTEGPKGHLYADNFTYEAYDLTPPFTPERYTEALLAAAKLNPAVVIIDSASHMHDGPGGMIEYHDAELDRLAGEDWKKRQANNFTAWIKPKKAENAFIEQMLLLPCHVVLCFRAKEKLRIVRGKEPENLGWQPIAGDRITFETLFTLTLPPYSKGVPDLAISEMRTPFDRMIRDGQQIDEGLGERVAAFARGDTKASPVAAGSRPASDDDASSSRASESRGEAGRSPEDMPDDRRPGKAPEWSAEEFTQLLKDATLTVTDLRPLIGAVTRDNWRLAVDAWLLSNPGKGIRDLIAAAVPSAEAPAEQQAFA